MDACSLLICSRGCLVVSILIEMASLKSLETMDYIKVKLQAVLDSIHGVQSVHVHMDGGQCFKVKSIGLQNDQTTVLVLLLLSD